MSQSDAMTQTKRARRRARRVDAPAPYIRELMELGWCRNDAEHLTVLELALDMATELGADAVQSLAQSAAVALAWQPVRCGALSLLTDGADRARAWRALADASDDEYARGVMLRLAAWADGREVVTCDADEVGSLISEEDMHLQEAARVAEATGRFAEAAAYVRSSLRPMDDGWLTDLEALAARGPDLPPDAWARWLVDAALRWSLATPAGWAAACSMSAAGLSHLGATPEMIREHTAARATQDVLIHDALLFDGGGLEAFVEERLSPELAARTPHLDDWLVAGPSIVLLEDYGSNSVLLCRDLVTGDAVHVGDSFHAEEHPLGTCFFGRLVLVGDGDVRYFLLRPLVIPEAALPEMTEVIKEDAGPERRLVAALEHSRTEL